MKAEILIHNARLSRSFFLAYSTEVKQTLSPTEWSTLLKIHNLTEKEVKHA